MKDIIIIFSAILLISSCTKDPVSPPEPVLPIIECESDAVEVAASDKQAEAVTDFGIKIFQEAVKNEDGINMVMSPLSIYSALLLAYEGSACNTKAQIMQTLELGDGNQNVEASGEYLNFMNSILPTEEVVFTFANALFADPSRIDMSENYVAGIQEEYNAEAFEIDFGAEDAVDSINDWAYENTNEKIEKVLDEISNDEIAFLLNAIYFKGDWLSGFSEDLTQDAAFQLSNGTSIVVPTMRTDAQLSNFVDENFQIVDLDIKGEEYAVSFITTRNDNPLNDFLTGNNFLQNYNYLLSSLKTDRLILQLPKFELEGKISLGSILAGMGMEDAFSLRRMGTAGANIFITRVLHDTYIKVDEKGIEGAAVTTIGIGTTSVPPPMNFDKAFAFVLRHKATGVPIFIGKIENPLE